jgi:hypothetical protein
MKRVILAVASDKHGGHKLGLLNPNTILEDEDHKGNLIEWTPELESFQQYLWGLHQEHVEDVKRLAGKDEIIVFDNGDLTAGNKYPHEQVSTRIADQFDIAAWNLRPWLDLPNVKTVRITKGTGAHNFGEGSAEIITQRILKGWYPKKDIRTIYHGLAKIAGIAVDYTHHGSGTGSRNWLKGNEFRYYLKSLIQDEIDLGNTPPDLIIRGHFHEYIEEYVIKLFMGKRYKVQGNIIPSYCGIDDYARQVTKSKYILHHGMVCYEIIDGKILDTYPMFNTIDIRTKEKIV